MGYFTRELQKGQWESRENDQENDQQNDQQNDQENDQQNDQQNDQGWASEALLLHRACRFKSTKTNSIIDNLVHSWSFFPRIALRVYHTKSTLSLS